MKKAPLIAVSILVLLVGVYFWTARKPSAQIKTPLTIGSLTDLTRVELLPGNKAEATMVVFERRNGDWWLTRPISARAALSAQQILEQTFARPIKTDDVQIDAGKTADYLLDDDSAVRLSLFSEEDTEPALDLLVGKEIEIAQTGTRRTYIKTTDTSRLYRAQVALGDFVRAPISALRSRRVVPMSPDEIVTLSFQGLAHTSEEPKNAKNTVNSPENLENKPNSAENSEKTADLAQNTVPGTVEFRHDAEGWTLASRSREALIAGAPDGAEVDRAQIATMIQQLARLQAEDFADKVKPVDAGMNTPRATWRITDEKKTYTLRFGAPVDDSRRYVQFDDGPIFIISDAATEQLSPTIDSLFKTFADSPENPRDLVRTEPDDLNNSTDSADD